ncbi:MAG: cyclodeaminase/cyclohydrolase family protein [Candidatus Omnitrophica bacterium]|nr:cyclodeaminase/cyclohydrolase family protein [Candidatus Omnitrophota bacterium]
MYRNASLKKYLDDLADKLAAPGGGSAAALAGALGVSLISMVINFTIGKPKYSRYEKKLKGILEESESLRKELLRLVDLDVIAYRSKDIRQAMDVPFVICKLCFKAIKLCPPLIKIGNINLISDVAVAAVLLESAFAAAHFNVEINLRCLRDKKLSLGVKKDLKAKVSSIKKIRVNTEVSVGKIIRG